MESRVVRLGSCELKIAEEGGRVYIFQEVVAVDSREVEEDWLVAEDEPCARDAVDCPIERHMIGYMLL